MKVFICACAALTIIALIVTFSGFFTTGALKDLDSGISQLPETIKENDEASDRILGCLDYTTNRWNDKQFTLALFVSHKELDEVDTLLTTLSAAVKAGDGGHYTAALASLKEKLEKLEKSEKLSIEGIL